MGFNIIRPADRQGWLQEREKGIGSSEVGTILGVNPFETPYQLWMRKTGKLPPVAENEAMRAGHILEGAVATYFEQETDRQVIKASEGDWLAVDPERPYLRVSPDRTYWLEGRHSKYNKGILECKTTQIDICGDDVPKHWFVQIMYQLGVMGYRQGSLAWLTRGRKFGYRDVMFDADLYAYMVEKLEQFWVDNIQGGKEPAPTSVDDIVLMFPRSEAKFIEVDETTMSKYNLLKSVKAQMDDLKEQKDELEGYIKGYMLDADTLCAPGSKDTNPSVLATWKTAKDSVKFDEKKFAAEHPELYKTYQMTVAGSRRFVLK